MNRPHLHPAERFSAPARIRYESPLKDLMDRPLIRLIGESLASVVPDFDPRRFQAAAAKDLATLELNERAMRIAQAMSEQLPADFAELAPLLIRSFGPPLRATAGNGLAPFFYLPHSQLIATRGVADFESAMVANYELTQRFTAEYSIRPLLVRYRSPALRLMKRWAKDPSPHVRRLVSEGTRPRLPWAKRLPEFQQNPQLALPLLERLKDDPDLYVRRSVANHLGDIAKDHPKLVFDLCEEWLAQVGDAEDDPRAKNRRWIVRHAVRLPFKKGEPRAIAIRAAATVRR